MTDGSDRLHENLLAMCRATRDVADRDIEVALIEALPTVVIDAAASEADARRRVASIAKVMRSDVRLHAPATW